MHQPRCISLFSYIKPQLSLLCLAIGYVVYLCFPTSNRNLRRLLFTFYSLYIFVFLHQTATYPYNAQDMWSCISLFSYIKPQLTLSVLYSSRRCISLFSYIKPQQHCYLPEWQQGCISLFSYIKPQPLFTYIALGAVVYLCFPTSNRNKVLPIYFISIVVYLCFPTSNRNNLLQRSLLLLLYIFVFLHQTATCRC